MCELNRGVPAHTQADLELVFGTVFRRILSALYCFTTLVACPVLRW